MKTFLLVLVSAVCVSGRPEPPIGYSYPVPNSIASIGPVAPVASVASAAPLPTQVHKHVYVHVAPEEPEEQRQRQQLPIGPPQKHYKIIFIKAPSPPTYSAPIIPVQPQNEEKTLVYVLVKKPEDPQEVVIPTVAPTKPSKPEVYFIKYKTQKEAHVDNVAVDSGAARGTANNDSYLGGSLTGGNLPTNYGPPKV
ncbi:titin [Aethina tumida]|uniref:titin n=1 Tax=Aethina tumida TaxID=116153 RepID=UPI00214899CC|nr:titin [Aethina tumida]